MGAALDFATGDAVVLMDADLQDQPEVIPEFVQQYQAGADVVFARRTTREEGVAAPGGVSAVLPPHRRLSDTALPVDSGDFALLGAPVVAALRRLPEQERYLRGLRAWVGFNQVGIDVNRKARQAGRAKYTTWKLVKLARRRVCSFSIVPLRAAAVTGLVAIAGSIAFALYAVYVRLADGQVPEGFTASLLIMTFLSGVQLLFLGVIGEYLGRVYGEAKGRPPVRGGARSLAQTDGCDIYGGVCHICIESTGGGASESGSCSERSARYSLAGLAREFSMSAAARVSSSTSWTAFGHVEGIESDRIAVEGSGRWRDRIHLGELATFSSGGPTTCC